MQKTVKAKLRDSDGFDEVERIAAALGAVIGDRVGRPSSILALRRVMDSNMEVYAIMKGELRTEIKWH
jgi:hypothetical protein